jgi:Domain of unknown function (DUF6531)
MGRAQATAIFVCAALLGSAVSAQSAKDCIRMSSHGPNSVQFKCPEQRVEIAGAKLTEPSPTLPVGSFTNRAPGIQGRHGNGKGLSSSASNTADPAALDSSEVNCSQTTGNPVVIATGEKVKTETDFVSRGLYGFGVVRTYRSKNTSSTALFGPNWPSNLDGMRLSWSGANCQPGDGPYCYPRSAVLTEVNGAKYEYKQPLNVDGYRVYNSASKGVLYYVGSARLAGNWNFRAEPTGSIRRAGSRVPPSTARSSTTPTSPAN